MAASKTKESGVRLFPEGSPATGLVADSAEQLANMGVTMHQDFVTATFGKEAGERYGQEMARRRTQTTP